MWEEKILKWLPIVIIQLIIGLIFYLNIIKEILQLYWVGAISTILYLVVDIHKNQKKIIDEIKDIKNKLKGKENMVDPKREVTGAGAIGGLFVGGAFGAIVAGAPGAIIGGIIGAIIGDYLERKE